MALIGWIDFSPEHRDRVASVLEMLRPEGVIDELGIGVLRDSLADLMFLGLNTIQTRAKYFFLVPYTLHEYRRLPLAKRRKTPPEKYLEDREYEVMWRLAEKYEHKTGSGVIGITKVRPQKIMRRPSAIYWNGLAVFDLVGHGERGVEAFLRSCAHAEGPLSADVLTGDDAPGDDRDVDHANPFMLGLSYQENWFEHLTLDLTQAEAKLLSDRMRLAGRDMLLGALLEDKDLFDAFSQASTFAEFAKLATRKNMLTRPLLETVWLAHDFSELMMGAHITYNSLLQRRISDGSRDGFHEEWLSWAMSWKSRQLFEGGFDPNLVLHRAPRVRPHTRKFVLDWWDLVNHDLHNIRARDALVENQEFNTKRAKARLKTGRLEGVRESKWIGLTRLEYRMPQVKTIVGDIYIGLKANHA